MGHYVTARYYVGRHPALFYPGPPVIMVSLFWARWGQFIRMKSPPQHRSALLTLEPAGSPIAGFCEPPSDDLLPSRLPRRFPCPRIWISSYFATLLLQLLAMSFRSRTVRDDAPDTPNQVVNSRLVLAVSVTVLNCSSIRTQTSW